MTFLTSAAGIFVMIFGFGVLIFVHELGHFLAAKWAGIRTEGFAVGMGPVMLSWRKGIGVCAGSTDAKVVALAGKSASEMTSQELGKHGLGETEYSLRWLPIGGFVKMLGQEDLDPGAVSRDPRSYNVCPVGKRMVVVSAGVVMNIILALVFFMWAFMVGVQFDAPVIGPVSQATPAERAVAENAAELGVTKTGLQPADRVLTIDGDECRTFSDIAIAAAMSRRGVPLALVVERPGVPEPLRFRIVPEVDPATGMLSIGVRGPGSTNRLLEEIDGEFPAAYLTRAGLTSQGVKPGMRLVEAGGTSVATYDQFETLVADHGGTSIPTQWQAEDEDGHPVGARVAADVPIGPDFQVMLIPELAEDGRRDIERGLFGLVPLTRVARVVPGSHNTAVLRDDDALLRIGTRTNPTPRALLDTLAKHPGREIAVTVLRDGKEVSFDAEVRGGRLGFEYGYAWDVPAVAEVVERVVVPSRDGTKTPPVATPAAGLGIAAGSVIESVAQQPTTNWYEVREAFRTVTRTAAGTSTGADVVLAVRAPGAETASTVTLALTAENVSDLHALSWSSDLERGIFEPLNTTLSAGGDPLLALKMGFTETHKMITMTYLTIDRLFRRTVSVEQLRGPVGIIDLGTKVLPRGFMFFLFFLGMISVNLAVLNFLPLPIVDGGLFLFLVYEKIRGMPPSVRFQNAAAIVGLCLIGAVFVVTFYNDIMRLVTT